MIIEIDCGNTQAKWREYGGEVLVHNYDEGFSSSVLYRALAAKRAPTVRLSCVSAPSFIPPLTSLVKANEGKVVNAITQRSCAGVTNSYDDVSRMGVDRWVAMVAAFNRSNSACCVIDAGTALTIDCVAANGRHLGGLIVPGKRLQLESLSGNTKKVKFAADKAIGEMAFGTDTQSAVYNGLAFMMTGLIHQAVAEFVRQVGGPTAIYLAGGNASELAPHLSFAFDEWNDIVLDGLRYVAD